jgi:hypothetical protein
MSIWQNNDGLEVRFGTSQAEVSDGGAPSQSGPSNFHIWEVDLVDLAATVTEFSESNGLTLGKGSIIVGATIDVLVGATSGGAAALNVGIQAKTAAGTDDPDGIDAAVALTAIDTKGERVTCDGAIIGTALDDDYNLTLDYDTAVYTAGRIQITIETKPTLNREDQ